MIISLLANILIIRSAINIMDLVRERVCRRRVVGYRGVPVTKISWLKPNLPYSVAAYLTYHFFSSLRRPTNNNTTTTAAASRERSSSSDENKPVFGGGGGNSDGRIMSTSSAEQPRQSSTRRRILGSNRRRMFASSAKQDRVTTFDDRIEKSVLPFCFGYFTFFQLCKIP